MCRNLRNKRRAQRCRILARKVIRNPSGYECRLHEEADARHLAKGGGYTLREQSALWGLTLKPT